MIQQQQGLGQIAQPQQQQEAPFTVATAAAINDETISKARRASGTAGLGRVNRPQSQAPQMPVQGEVVTPESLGMGNELPMQGLV